jgi:hypothetical protein
MLRECPPRRQTHHEAVADGLGGAGVVQLAAVEAVQAESVEAWDLDALGAVALLAVALDVDALAVEAELVMLTAGVEAVEVRAHRRLRPRRPGQPHASKPTPRAPPANPTPDPMTHPGVAP